MLDQHDGSQTRLRQSRKKKVNIARARRILHGESAQIDEVLHLARRLARSGNFGYGRRLLSKILPTVGTQNPNFPELVHLFALCCSKDHAMRGHQALARALATLQEVADLAQT